MSGERKLGLLSLGTYTLRRVWVAEETIVCAIVATRNTAGMSFRRSSQDAACV